MTVVLVTGGASGIGAAVARRFARSGANVVVADVDEEGGAAVAAEIGGRFVPADVSRPADNESAVRVAIDEFGGLDVVHLNAGIASGIAVGEKFDVDRYRRTIGVNLDGVTFGLDAALPALASRSGGSVVVTASLAGLAPIPMDPVYGATKHAVIGLVRSLAPIWANSNVTINAVCPGFVDTAILTDSTKDTVRENGLAIADPAEIAAAVEFVVSDRRTGNAWMVQAGRPPTAFEFAPVDLVRTDTPGV